MATLKTVHKKKMTADQENINDFYGSKYVSWDLTPNTFIYLVILVQTCIFHDNHGGPLKKLQKLLPDMSDQRVKLCMI